MSQNFDKSIDEHFGSFIEGGITKEEIDESRKFLEELERVR
jgi:hypothetical protein